MKIFYKITSLESKYYDMFGVILLAISGNFFYNFIMVNPSKLHYYIEGLNLSFTSNRYNGFFGIFFLIGGGFFLYYAYLLKKIENDYLKLKYKLSQFEWKKIRVSKKYRYIAFSLYTITLIIIILPFVTKIMHVDNIKTVQVFNNKDEISIQSKYSNYNHYFESQFKLLSFYISKTKKKDTINIIDVACGSGELVSMIKDSFPSVNIFGSDGDSIALKYAKSNLQSKKLNSFIINRPILWQELSHNGIINIRKWDYVCLLGNSIPALNNNEDIVKTFIEINKILKKNGLLFVDFKDKDDIVISKRIFIGKEKDIQLYEIFKDKGKYFEQTLYTTNTEKKIQEKKFKLYKLSMDKEILIRDLLMANFKIISSDSMHYCEDLSLIIAQKK